MIFFVRVLFHNVVREERIFNLCSVVSVLIDSVQTLDCYRPNDSREFREARLKMRLETGRKSQY